MDVEHYDAAHPIPTPQPAVKAKVAAGEAKIRSQLAKLQSAQIGNLNKIEAGINPGARATYPDNRRGPRTP